MLRSSYVRTPPFAPKPFVATYPLLFMMRETLGPNVVMNVVAGCGVAPACCDGSLTALRSVSAGATGPPSFLMVVPAALGTFAGGGVWNRSPRTPGSLGIPTACATIRRCTGCMAMVLWRWRWRVRAVFRVVVLVTRVRRAAVVGLPCSRPCHPCLLCLLCHLCLPCLPCPLCLLCLR